MRIITFWREREPLKGKISQTKFTVNTKDKSCGFTKKLHQKLFPETHQSGFNSRVNSTTAFKIILLRINSNGEALVRGIREQ